MALTQMKILATAIIRAYSIQVVENHPVVPSDSVVLNMKYGLKIRVAKRSAWLPALQNKFVRSTRLWCLTIAPITTDVKQRRKTTDFIRRSLLLVHDSRFESCTNHVCNPVHLLLVLMHFTF